MAELIAVEAAPEKAVAANPVSLVQILLEDHLRQRVKMLLEDIRVKVLMWLWFNCAVVLILAIVSLMSANYRDDTFSHGTAFVTEVLWMPNRSLIDYCFVVKGCPDTPETPGGRCGLTAFDPESNPFCRNPSNNGRIIANAYTSFFRTQTFYVNDENGRYPSTSPCNFLWPALKMVLSLGLSNQQELLDPDRRPGFERFQLSGPDVRSVSKQFNFWHNLCDVNLLYSDTVIGYVIVQLQHGSFSTRHDLY
jgi:hypothetical protein